MNTPAGPSALPARGDSVEVKIEKIVFGGDGLARLGEGFVVFVPFAAAGDRLRVRILERKPHHARGDIVEILEPGPHRATPPCPYYGRCGGCQYQHLTYTEQCQMKEAQVREAFARVGKWPDAPILRILAAPNPFHYRNRITVHAEAGRIGFRALDGRELVDVAECLIARDDVNAQLAVLRASRPLEGHHSIRDATVPRSGFFQANHDLRDALQKLVADALPEKGHTLLEGYCGGGFFTAAVAGRFTHVVGIDNDERTLRDAQRLALPNVEWREADAAFELGDELRTMDEATRGDTSVLLDPPREGLPVRLAEALVLDPVAHLVYVSCNPATLARDARLLAKTYRLVSVQPIDLFPQTAQIECVTVWRRGDSASFPTKSS